MTSVNRTWPARRTDKIRIALAVRYLVQYHDQDPDWWHAIEAYVLKSELLDLIRTLSAPSSGAESPFEYLLFPDEDIWRNDAVPAPLPTNIRLSLIQRFGDGSIQHWNSVRSSVHVVAPQALEDMNATPERDGNGWESVVSAASVVKGLDPETFAALHNRRMFELLPTSRSATGTDYLDKLRTALETGGLLRFDEQCLQLPAGYAAHVFDTVNEFQQRCTNRQSLLGLMGKLGPVATADSLPEQIRIGIDEILFLDVPAASAAIHRSLRTKHRSKSSRSPPIDDIAFPGGLDRCVYASWSWVRGETRFDAQVSNAYVALFTATRGAFPTLDVDGQESVVVRIHEEAAPDDVRLVALIEGDLAPYFPKAPSVRCFTPRIEERERLLLFTNQAGQMPPARLLVLDENSQATLVDSSAQVLATTFAWDEAESGGLPRVHFKVPSQLKVQRAVLAIVVATAARQAAFGNGASKHFEYTFGQSSPLGVAQFDAVELSSAIPTAVTTRVEVGSVSTVRFEPANSFERMEFEVLASPRAPDASNDWEVLRFNDLWSMVTVRSWRQSGGGLREVLNSDLTALLPAPDPRSQDQHSPNRHYHFAARRRESSPEFMPQNFEPEQIARLWQTEAGQNSRFGFVAEDRYGRRRALGDGLMWEIGIPAFPREVSSLAAVRLGGQDSRPLVTWSFDAPSASVIFKFEFSALRRDAASPMNPSLAAAAWRSIADAALAQSVFVHVYSWRASNQGTRYELSANDPSVDTTLEDRNPFQDELVFSAKVDVTNIIRTMCGNLIPPVGVAPAPADQVLPVALSNLKDQKRSSDPITPVEPTYANGHVMGVMLELERAPPHDAFTGAEFRTLNGPHLDHPYNWFNGSGVLETKLLDHARRQWGVARVPVVAQAPLFDNDQLPGLLGLGVTVNEVDTQILFSRAHLSDIPGYRPVPDAIHGAAMAVGVPPPPAAHLLTDQARRVLARIWEALAWATNWSSPSSPEALLTTLARIEPTFLELARIYLNRIGVAHESTGDVPLSVSRSASMLLGNSVIRLSRLLRRDFLDRRTLNGIWPTYLYIDLQSGIDEQGINPDLHLFSMNVTNLPAAQLEEFKINTCRRSFAFSSLAQTLGRLFRLPYEGFIATLSDPKTTRYESLLEPDLQVPSVPVTSFEGPNSIASTPARILVDLPNRRSLRSPSLLASISIARWLDPRLFEQRLKTELNQLLSLESLVSGDIVRASSRQPSVEVLAVASQVQGTASRGDSVGVLIAEIDVDPVMLAAGQPWDRDSYALLQGEPNLVNEGDLSRCLWWDRLAGDAPISECWRSVIEEAKGEEAALEELATLASNYSQLLNVDPADSAALPLVEFAVEGTTASPVVHILGIDHSLIPAVTIALLRVTRVAGVSSYALLIGIHHSVFRQRNCVLEHRRDVKHAKSRFNIAGQFAQRRSLSTGSLLSATGLRIDASSFFAAEIPRSVDFGLDFLSRALTPITDSEGVLWSAYGWLLDPAQADHPDEIMVSGTIWVSKRVPLPILGSDGNHQHSSAMPAATDWIPVHRFDGTRGVLESTVWPQLKVLQYGSQVLRVDVAFFRPKVLVSQSQWSAVPFLEIVGRPIRWID